MTPTAMSARQPNPRPATTREAIAPAIRPTTIQPSRLRSKLGISRRVYLWRMLKRIDHIGIVVDDLEAGRHFLESLGFRHSHDLEVPERGLHASFWRCGDASIELLQMDDEGANRDRMQGERMARIEHICVEVDDIEQTVEEMHGKGVEFTSGPSKVGANTSVWSKPESSDGYQFQFMQKGES